DQDANVRLLEQMLSDAGYTRITSTMDPYEVCTLYRQNRYDLILLDLQMPGMDGVEVSRRLRGQDSTATIPIIVMSAKDRLKATTARMQINDQLSKPFGLAQLYAVVRRWSGAA
ncbi:MAG: response regulator, partial [Chloroflexota bacterium]